MCSQDYEYTKINFIIHWIYFQGIFDGIASPPIGLPVPDLNPSSSFPEENILPPFSLPMERDVSSDSVRSVCFSFFIGLLSCRALSTGPEDAAETTLVFLVDKNGTSTSLYVTIPQLSDFVGNALPTHSSIVSNSLSTLIEDLYFLCYLAVVFSACDQRGWII